MPLAFSNSSGLTFGGGGSAGFFACATAVATPPAMSPVTWRSEILRRALPGAVTVHGQAEKAPSAHETATSTATKPETRRGPGPREGTTPGTALTAAPAGRRAGRRGGAGPRRASTSRDPPAPGPPAPGAPGR